MKLEFEYSIELLKIGFGITFLSINFDSIKILWLD